MTEVNIRICDYTNPDHTKGIADLIVLPGYRRKGIGRQLLEAVIAIGRERGCSRITLEVRKDNLSAQHLYQSLGFGEPLPAMHYWRKELE